jgi:hypothetical protein
MFLPSVAFVELIRLARACSVSMETEHAPDSLFGRIFYGKPVSTFPENALEEPSWSVSGRNGLTAPAVLHPLG